MEIAFDYDGTIRLHDYRKLEPNHIAPEVPGAFEVMKKLQDKGHKILLFTMRSDEHLLTAIRDLEANGIRVYGANRNPRQNWTNSPKCYAQLYIDDAALGCPLIVPTDGSRAYVDYRAVESHLHSMGLI